MLSHGNLIFTGATGAREEGLRADEEVLAYLPMAWIGDHLFSYAQSILVGFAVSCPESTGTVTSRPPGDRPDVLLRAAAHLGERPHERDDPSRGRGVGEAEAHALLPRPGAGHRAPPAHRPLRPARRRRQLGGAAAPPLHELRGPRPEARGLRPHLPRDRAREPQHRAGRAPARRADPQVPHPAQGARRGRPGGDPHPKAAARPHRGALLGGDRRPLRGRRPGRRRGAGDVRRRPDRHGPRRSQDSP